MKTLLADFSTLWLMAASALCFGFIFNQFRDIPILAAAAWLYLRECKR